MSANETGKDRSEDDPISQQKPRGTDGRGQDGTIPGSADGVGIGAETETNTFEPEEDPDASAPEDIEDSSGEASEPS